MMIFNRKKCDRVKDSFKHYSTHFSGRTKYILVHLFEKSMAGVEMTRTGTALRYLSYFTDLTLISALGLGFYTQWSFTGRTAVAVISILGAFVFAVSFALTCYLDFRQLGKALFHVWVGCLLGILAFINQRDLEDIPTEKAMEAMFLVSMILGWISTVLKQVFAPKMPSCGILTRYGPKVKDVAFLTLSEGLESLGLIVASFFTGVDYGALVLFILAYVCHLVAIKLKSLFSLLSFIGFVVVSVTLFFPALEVKPNTYALICFAGRHTFQPILEFLFSDLSMIDKWTSFFNQARLLRYLSIIVFCVADLIYAGLVGYRTSKHKEWFIVLPLYLVLCIAWIMFHLMFVVSCWRLMGKISECNARAGERRNYHHVMASKGLRHFALVSQRVMSLTVFMTLLMFFIGFETRTPYTLALFFVVMPVEMAIDGLFRTLGNDLGGTCTGYAIISPATLLQPGSGAQLLSSSGVEEISSRGTSVLQQMSHLLSYHMLQNFGCDYNSSGLEFSALETKLKTFFEIRTSDGPKFDTYILYYCGDTFNTGDWALANNRSLDFATLLDWWQEGNKEAGTRLILVLDTKSSYKWAQEVHNRPGCYVAIQTCRYFNKPDVETGSSNIGDFTQNFVHYNCDQEMEVDWTTRSRQLEALYKVSRDWTQFSFRLPTKEEVENHWRDNMSMYPKVLKQIMSWVNLYGFGCFKWPSLGFRQWLMHLWPSRELDTGHGIRLIRT